MDNQTIDSLLEPVEPEWRDDARKMLAGEGLSPSFGEHLDACETCQKVVDEGFRLSAEKLGGLRDAMRGALAALEKDS